MEILHRTQFLVTIVIQKNKPVKMFIEVKIIVCNILYSYYLNHVGNLPIID